MKIQMHRAPCDILALDIVDVTSVHLVGVGGKLYKRRLDKNGNIIDSNEVVSLIEIYLLEIG